jgi:hypothetical protein
VSPGGIRVGLSVPRRLRSYSSNWTPAAGALRCRATEAGFRVVSASHTTSRRKFRSHCSVLRASPRPIGLPRISCKHGKPRRRDAWVAFELGLWNLELPYLLTRITFAQLHFIHSPRPQAPRASTAQHLRRYDGSRPLLPPARHDLFCCPDARGNVYRQTSIRSRPRAERTDWIVAQPQCCLGRPSGRTPCVTPKPGAHPRFNWSNWTQVTLVPDSFPCKRKPPLRFAPDP